MRFGVRAGWLLQSVDSIPWYVPYFPRRLRAFRVCGFSVPRIRVASAISWSNPSKAVSISPFSANQEARLWRVLSVSGWSAPRMRVWSASTTSKTAMAGGNLPDSPSACA